MSQFSSALPSVGVIRHLQAQLSSTGPSWSLPFSPNLSASGNHRDLLPGKVISGSKSGGCRSLGPEFRSLKSVENLSVATHTCNLGAGMGDVRDRRISGVSWLLR